VPSELDVVEIALGDLRDGALDLARAEPKALGRPVVEFLRQVAHGSFAARLDIGEDFFDRLAHLCVRRLDGARVHSALEAAGHGVLLHVSLIPRCCTIVAGRTVGWAKA